MQTPQTSQISGSVARRVKYDMLLPSDIDRDIWINAGDSHDFRAGEVAPGFLHAGLRSHVILSACGSQELAYEDTVKERGYFTTALLNILTSTRADQITYTQLIKQIQILDSGHKYP